MDLTTLRSVYMHALDTCRPSRLLQARGEELPRTVVAMGKAAAELVRGMRDRSERFFVAVPDGYGERGDFPADATVYFGSHPELSESSFAAGAALLEFVASQRQPILFLISGGSSACVEWPLDGFSKEELIRTNHTLIRSGWDIEKINTVRKDYSAIKGGRLGALAPPGSVALILSDVPPGLPELVGSGPTFGPGTRVRNELLADNRTLLGAAAASVEQLGYVCKVLAREINDEVQTSAEFLLETTRSLPAGTIAVAGGEPTVRVIGSGRGGRCSEMALRFALLAHERRLTGLSALFASSDGMDGNSGAAGVMVSTRKVVAATFPASEVAAALAASDSFRLAESVGEPIIIPPTGNNLRDLFLLART